MKDANGLLVGHPFNPPYLIPLVEVVPGKRTAPEATGDAVAFYQALGKAPGCSRRKSRVSWPTACSAHYARGLLPRAARRVTVDELDEIATSSIGLRGLSMGVQLVPHGRRTKGWGCPCRPRQEHGGFLQGGIPQARSSDETLRQRIIDQAAASFVQQADPQMERKRDDAQIALLHALATVASQPADGQSSAAHSTDAARW